MPKKTIKKAKASPRLKSFAIEGAAALLAAPNRQKSITSIKTSLMLEAPQYKSLCHALIENYASIVQSLPASRHSYYAKPGGFLDYGLYRAEIALDILRGYFKFDSKSKAQLSDNQQRWAYAVFSGSLLQSIGKLISDFDIELFDDDNNPLGTWNPTDDPMPHFAKQFSYTLGPNYPESLQIRATLMLAHKLMPKEGLTWLSNDKNVLSAWFGMLTDDADYPPFQTIVMKARAVAINRYYKTLYSKTKSSAKALRHVKTTFSEPTKSKTLESELYKTGIAFLRWMQQKMFTQEFMINQAPLHYVPGGLLICPDIYYLFVRENPEYKNQLAVQESFANLGLHHVGPNNEIYHTYRHQFDGSEVTGMVISNIHVVFPEAINLEELPFEPLKGHIDMTKPLVITPEVLQIMPELQANFEMVPQNLRIPLHLYLIDRDGKILTRDDNQKVQEVSYYKKKTKNAIEKMLRLKAYTTLKPFRNLT